MYERAERRKSDLRRSGLCLPTADDVTCEECGHGKAWYTIKQTGAADEPPTRFFKCQDCGYRWREYN